MVLPLKKSIKVESSEFLRHPELDSGSLENSRIVLKPKVFLNRVQDDVFYSFVKDNNCDIN